MRPGTVPARVPRRLRPARILGLLGLGLVAVGPSGCRMAQSPDVEARAAAPSDTLWIRDVHVLPMTSDTLLRDRTVRIVDGTIDAILAAAEAAPTGGTVVAGEGRYLMPGLVDFHVHLRHETELVSYLAHGVTTVVNMRGLPEIVEWRRLVAEGDLPGPRIITSGPLIDGDPPIWDPPGTTVVRTEAEGRSAVREQARQGYQLIKTYNQLDPGVLRAIVDEARVHGLAVVGHIPRNPDRATALQKALDAGMAMIAHAEEIFFTYLGGASDAALRSGSPAADPERIQAAAEMVAEAGAAVTPTLSFIAMTDRMLDDLDAVLDHPESTYLSAGVREMWEQANPTRRPDLDAFSAREAVKWPAMRALTLELHRRGVPLLLGTDASAPGMHPGASAILELEELMAGGLDPHAALAAGTRVPGEFLARHVRGTRPVGTIEPGHAADLVLVDGDPRQDFGVLRDPAGVLAAGRWLSRERLAELRSPPAVR